MLPLVHLAAQFTPGFRMIRRVQEPAGRHAYHQPEGRRSTGVSWRSPMVMGKLKQPSPDDLPMNDIHQR